MAPKKYRSGFWILIHKTYSKSFSEATVDLLGNMSPSDRTQPLLLFPDPGSSPGLRQHQPRSQDRSPVARGRLEAEGRPQRLEGLAAGGRNGGNRKFFLILPKWGANPVFFRFSFISSLQNSPLDDLATGPPQVSAAEQSSFL